MGNRVAIVAATFFSVTLGAEANSSEECKAELPTVRTGALVVAQH
jgi:hypothetical protein